jgi:L-lactate dehydrogenase complex protein LldG
MDDKAFQDYMKLLYKVRRDRFTRTALRRAVDSFRQKRDEALKAFPHVEKEKKKLQETKDHVIKHFDDYIEKTEKAVKMMHGNFHFAKEKEDALRILKGITGSGKTIVKGKSITSEEIDMNENLEKWGNTVYETDLGEFIVQNLHSRPMHILAPAVNIPKEKVAELFSKIAHKELPSDAEKLTAFAREFLREKYMEADIGISGANAITADTGSVFLFENEGNIRFATNAPDVHVVFAGIEKIVPRLEDGFRLLEVVSRYAGYLAMTYVSIISGPSKTGDIEKTIVYGAHGPREFHVILYDSGRSEVAKDPDLAPMLRCVRCGACMYECCIYPITTGYWGYKYMGGIGIPWTAHVAGGIEKAAPMAFTCTLCGRCVEYCPMEIDTPEIVMKLREELNAKGLIPPFIKNMVKTVMKDGVPY